ncbi:uncharacterized protein LOC134693473 [Mytilus trossulus]|uniref:uncharacterized protein LOC134693473 n=1 Tax=Mytilus trossulus TaxID=6551 RepID=UPI00300469F8
MICDTTIKQYQLPLTENKEARNELFKTRKYCIGDDAVSIIDQTVILVGATGSGKTTLINAMVNHIAGVKWEDKARLVLIPPGKEGIDSQSQSVSQTRWVTCYKIHRSQGTPIYIKHAINLIDTPGFGHTGGIKYDKEIVNQIENLFKCRDERGVRFVDAICFVVKAPDARLTSSQRYIFTSVLSLFGNDIKEHICTVITFADGQTPPVVEALKDLDEKAIPYESYFTVNNSALYVENTSDHFHCQTSKLFWDLGKKSMQKFFEHIQNLRTKSLSLTTEVLILRRSVDALIKQMQDTMERGLAKIDSIQQELDIYEAQRKKFRDNLDFTYEIEEIEIQKIDTTKKVEYSYNCTRCKYSCHENCTCNTSKEQCISMEADGTCRNCPLECDMMYHEKETYHFRNLITKSTKTYNGKKRSCKDATQCIQTQIEIISKMHSEMNEAEDTLSMCLPVVTHRINKLKLMALLKNPMSVEDYLEMLIQKERLVKKIGFDRRIAFLKRQKQQAKLKTTTKENVDAFKTESGAVRERIRLLYLLD